MSAVTNTVDDQLTAHTYSVYIKTTLAAGSWVLIRYSTDNHRVPGNCSGGARCLTFPTLNWVLYQPTATIAASQPTVNSAITNGVFTVDGMTNGWYSHGGQSEIEYWSPSGSFLWGSTVTNPTYALINYANMTMSFQAT
jgi:hypothetical protein